MMRQTSSKLGMAALVFAMLGSFGTSSALAAKAGSPRFNPPHKYYLALGDSLSFGFQHSIFDANFPTENPSAFNTGYVDDFAAMLAGVRPGIQTVNDGCPNETTDTFIAGGCTYTAAGFALHNAYSGSQMTAAVDFLHAHPGQVSPITVSIGSNDINALLDTCGFADIRCLDRGTPAVLAHLSVNLSLILSTLRAAAPNSEIIVLQYYNPLALVLQPSIPYVNNLNAIIAASATASGARVADAYTPFNVASPQPQTLCVLTLFCTQRDIHPSNAGYAVIAQQFWVASDYARLIDSGA